jgi:hypothetical protein
MPWKISLGLRIYSDGCEFVEGVKLSLQGADWVKSDDMEDKNYYVECQLLI